MKGSLERAGCVLTAVLLLAVRATSQAPPPSWPSAPPGDAPRWGPPAGTKPSTPIAVGVPTTITGQASEPSTVGEKPASPHGVGRPLDAPPPPPNVRAIYELAPIPDDGLGLKPRLTASPTTPMVVPRSVRLEVVSPTLESERGRQANEPAMLPAPILRAASPDVPPATLSLPSAGIRTVSAYAAETEAGPSPAAPAANPSPSSTTPPPGIDAPPPNQARTPSVTIEKVGPTSLVVGQALAYEIVVRNVGTIPVYSVRVDEETPIGSKLLRMEPRSAVNGQHLRWELGNLEAGAERRMKVEVLPQAEGELASNALVTFSAACPLRTRITRPKLALAKTGPQSAIVGDVVPFQLAVTNAGDGPATNVVVRDRLPAGLHHPQGPAIVADLGTLAPGETKTLTLEATAVQVGTQINEAEATADFGQRATSQATLVVTQPGLLLRKTGPARRYLNGEVDFDFEVSNPGSAPATEVRVVDTLPRGLEFISASDGAVHDATARTVTWNVGTLSPHQRKGLTLKAACQASGDFVNRAVATGDRGLQVPAEAPLHVEGVPALMLEVVDLDDPVEVGNETVYEIRVLNQGSHPCTRLVVAATLPDGLLAKGGEGPANHRIVGKQVIFDAVPVLAPRADALYRVKVEAVRPGDCRFKVQMLCDQLTAPVNEDESTRVYAD